MKRLTTALVVAAVAIGILFAAVPARATYPGGNGRIAFAIDRGDGLQIHAVRGDGTDLQQLTDVAGGAIHPDWSLDGTQIVFTMFGDCGNESGCQIGMMGADGSGLTMLAGRLRPTNDPSFTPSGQRIIFASKDNTAIVTMDLEGHDRRTIFQQQVEMHNPVVSPDGRWITFLVVKPKGDGNRKGLFRIDRNGTHLQKIVPFRFDVSLRGGTGRRAGGGSRSAVRPARPLFRASPRTCSRSARTGEASNRSPTSRAHRSSGDRLVLAERPLDHVQAWNAQRRALRELEGPARRLRPDEDPNDAAGAHERRRLGPAANVGSSRPTLSRPDEARPVRLAQVAHLRARRGCDPQRDLDRAPVTRLTRSPYRTWNAFPSWSPR